MRRHPDPEGAVKGPKDRALAGALVRRELLTQREILEHERPSANEEAPQEAKEQGHQSILTVADKLNDFSSDGVFADNDP